MSKRRNDHDRDLPAADPLRARWVELGSADARRPSTDDIERRIGTLLAKVPAPAPLGRAAHARVLARLLDPKGRERITSPSWFGRLAMGSGLGALALLLSGAVIAAGGVGAWWKIAHPRAPSAPVGVTVDDEAPAKVRRHPRSRATPGAAAADQPAASSQLAPEPAAAPEPQASPPPPSISPRPTAPRSGPTALAQETRLLSTAMAELRQQHDGAAALATLDDYLGRYPNGTMLGEARRARVDALLLLGRGDEARRALDRLDLEPVGRGQELLLIRGELRAGQDCAAAIGDFDVVLRHAAPPSLAERALFGRAVCRQQEGQQGAARQDALAYLERFPAGRFADAARRLAAGQPDQP